MTLAPDDIVTTCGGQNAVRLCLEAVTRPGDTVVIETPTYFGLLEVLESLHLRALEVATFPIEGLCLDALEEAMRRHRVAALRAVPHLRQPARPLHAGREEDAGSRRCSSAPGYRWSKTTSTATSPSSARRPPPVKAFDTTGNVLLCSSFSKTLAPGLRVGWAAPGRYRRAVERLKFNSMLAVPTATQLAVAGFLEEGGYDRHLRRLRRACADLVGSHERRGVALVPGRHAREPPARRLRAVGGAARPASTRCASTSRRAPTASRSRPARSSPPPSATGTASGIAASTPWTPVVERAMERLGELVASRRRRSR